MSLLSDRQVQETITRCVSAMTHYQDGGRTKSARIRMDAEIEYLAAWTVEEMLLTPPEIATTATLVEAHLCIRPGDEPGRRLACEFVGVFHRALVQFAPVKPPVRPFLRRATGRRPMEEAATPCRSAPNGRTSE